MATRNPRDIVILESKFGKAEFLKAATEIQAKQAKNKIYNKKT